MQQALVLVPVLLLGGLHVLIGLPMLIHGLVRAHRRQPPVVTLGPGGLAARF